MNLFYRVLALLILLVFAPSAQSATTLLPNARQCFAGANGAYTSGSLNMFIPGTTNPKATWQDSARVTLNTEPIQLDANGCATIFGTGSYRQRLYDGPVVGGVPTGNLIWDRVTTDTSSYNSMFIAGLAGGTPNAITISYPAFTATAEIVNFTALQANTGPTTLNPGSGAIPVVKDTAAGPVALTGGEIQPNNEISVQFDPVSFSFHILNLISAAASTTQTPLCGAVNLRIGNNVLAPTTTIDVTADQVLMQTTLGGFLTRNNVTTTAALAVGLSGLAGGYDSRDAIAANQWWNVFVIDNGVNTAAFLSNSTHGNVPQLPSGYAYKCRVGAVNTNATAGAFSRMLQRGNRMQYLVTSQVGNNGLPLLGFGPAGTASATSPTYAALVVAATGAVCPPTATQIGVVASNNWDGAAAAIVQVAPSGPTLYGGQSSNPGTLNPPIYLTNGGAPANLTTSAWINLESTSIYWAASGAGGGLAAMGCQDAINAN